MEGELQQTVEGGSLETIRYMVATGIGITVLPCAAARADQFSQRLVTILRLVNPSPSRNIALSWRVSFPRPKVIDALKAAISECHLSCVEPLQQG